MHGPITKPQNATDRLVRADGSFDRAEIMRFAWAKKATWDRLVRERRADRAITFREALKEAWAMAKHMKGRAEALAEIAAASAREQSAAEQLAARRFFVEMSDDDGRRLRELDQIDREERAAKAA